MSVSVHTKQQGILQPKTWQSVTHLRAHLPFFQLTEYLKQKYRTRRFLAVQCLLITRDYKYEHKRRRNWSSSNICPSFKIQIVHMPTRNLLHLSIQEGSSDVITSEKSPSSFSPSGPISQRTWLNCEKVYLRLLYS